MQHLVDCREEIEDVVPVPVVGLVDLVQDYDEYAVLAVDQPDQGVEGPFETPSGERNALQRIVDDEIGNVKEDAVRGIDGLAVDVEEITVVVLLIGFFQFIADVLDDRRLARTGLSDYEYVRRFVLLEGGRDDVDDILDLLFAVDQLGRDIGVLKNAAVVDDVVFLLQEVVKDRLFTQ